MPQTSPIDSALIVGTATDPGRTGKNNEDSLDVFDADLQEDLRLRTVQVAVVADGIGGNNAGEIASRIAVEKIRSVIKSQPTVSIPDRLEQAVQLANQEVFNAAQNSAATRGMGSTVVIAAIVDDLLHVVHVGDSRAYLVRGNTAHRLTLDHTWAQEAIDHGILTPEAARVHPNRNVIKRYVGVDEAIAVDHKMIDIGQAPTEMEGAGRWPTVEQTKLQPGDTVLLCSDGLTDELTDDELRAAVRKYDTQAATDQLVAMANAHGGRDNITVVLMRVPGGAPPPPVAAAVASGKSRLPLLILAVVGLLAVAAIAAFVLARPKTDETPPATPVVEASTAAGEIVVASPTPEQAVQQTSGVAAVDTPTPTVGPAPTASGLITPTAAGAEGDVPTSTPIPTRTPSPVPPTPTPVPTRVSPTAGTASPTERSTRVAPGALAVGLVRPNRGDSGDRFVTFEWEVTAGALGPTQAYEVIFWPEGQDAASGVGLAEPTRGNSTTVNLADLDNSGFQLKPGNYLWGVRLIDSGRPSRLLSESRPFRWERVAPTPEPQPEKTLPPT